MATMLAISILRPHDAAHAAALACMLLSQHDDAGCRADNAHTEQHPRYQHAGLPGVAVAQQALEDHQYQHAKQAHLNTASTLLVVYSS